MLLQKRKCAYKSIRKEPSDHLSRGNIQLELTPFLEGQDEPRTNLSVSGDSIRKITKNYFRVKSQSGNGWYNVRRLQHVDAWTCDCKNFMYRLIRKDDKRCKHIIAAERLRNAVEQELRVEKLGTSTTCPQCNSTKIMKAGFRIVQDQVKRQIFQCRNCKHKFALRESGFASMRFEPTIVTESLNLIMSGMSYRSIARHIKAVHNVPVSHVAIFDWVKKYMCMIKDYVDSLKPELGDVWSVDEMMVNVKKTLPIKSKGFYVWIWTIIDPKTKFVIATEVSKKREIPDARKILLKGSKVSEPNYVITDSLNSYKDAIKKELDMRRTAHIMTKSLKDGFQNRPIERYHNEIREKLKTKRGLGTDESTQRFADSYRTYHNFIRSHTGLPNDMTPAEAAGIDLGLGHDRIRDLITKSVESKGNFAVQLGKRIELVETWA
jgi:putative transposase